MTEEPIIVKLSNPYVPSSLFRQTPGNTGTWKNIRFVMNEEVSMCDYWIVLNNMTKVESTLCSPDRTYLFALEGPSTQTYDRDYLQQFANVVTCQRGLDHPRVMNTVTTIFWLIDKTYDELQVLQHPKKKKNVSIICSNKTFTEGHKKRYDFALRLKKHFGSHIDLYGRGIKSFKDKWDILAPYRFSIAIENDVYPDWITEKLTDCFLSYTVPFYYGFAGANKYFPSDAYVPINIDDFTLTVEKINSVLSDKNFYERNIPALMKARDIALNELNFFALVNKIVNETKGNPVHEKVKVTLVPEST